MDLDSQVNTLSLKAHTYRVERAVKDWRTSARTRLRKEILGVPDYKSIIEKLQVMTHTHEYVHTHIFMCVCTILQRVLYCVVSRVWWHV